jgi:glycosyltransferase involved in cell wall biosynthesis
MSGGTRSYEMARRLVAKGHEVNMITSWREDDDRKGWFETNEAGIRVNWLPVPYSNTMGFGERIKAFVRFAWGAARKAASLPADVVFATSTPLTIALPGAYAAKRQKVPMVFEVRDLWPDVPIAMKVLKNSVLQFFSRKLEKWSYSRSKKVVALTPTMRDFLSGKGVLLENIAVIPNGADLEIFQVDHCPGGPIVNVTKELIQHKRILLYCGGLGPAHGPEYLVLLAEELFKQNSDILILVAGQGKLSGLLEAKSRECGCLEKTIRFIGKVPHDQVPALYSIADASIMTMADCELLYRHSVQNKFFDSLAAGKPVFANYAGWTSEIAMHEKAGFILDSDISTDSMNVNDLLHNYLWLEQAGHAARKLAEERFSHNMLCDQLEQVLLSAVENP